ncbi:SRPBCC family protein [Nocardia blacklockiae]|uniref:SRPBCC family protein n=1 Tax=Nocardia blacklockiae TaxID=480036 RepID=UPI001894729B|nr:SRPBCC family protein [Nocardia blacklockiae]MBF6172063.1 SRPBCC family protein [Nocardia blacklockiae]
MHPCERVEASFAETAPYRYSNSVELNVTPEQVFEVLADASAWPRWATVITGVTWTSPEPRGIGTTRTVHMRGGIVGNEEFLAWEPNTHMAFRFNECSTKGITAFAEDYRIVPTAGGCRLTWTMAMAGDRPTSVSLRLFGPLMNATFRYFLRNLRKLTDRRFATAAR